jgi:transposase
MGRYAPDFNDQHRAAVVAAVLEQGLSAREVVEAAAAGELGLEPFRISTSTVQGRVAAHRRREGVVLMGTDEAQRVRALAEKTIARVEAMDEPTAKDMHALREALRTVNAADRAAPRPAPKGAAPDPEGEALIARMQAELEAFKASGYAGYGRLSGGHTRGSATLTASSTAPGSRSSRRPRPRSGSSVTAERPSARTISG